MGSYVEYAPPPELARVVRTVWIQTVGDTPYVQRHLPTGGVEIHVPIGDSPRMLGPLTGPRIQRHIHVQGSMLDGEKSDKQP